MPVTTALPRQANTTVSEPGQAIARLVPTMQSMRAAIAGVAPASLVLSAVFRRQYIKKTLPTSIFSNIGKIVLWALVVTVAAEIIPLAAVLAGWPDMAGLLGAPAKIE